jgi:hypothetical protein
VENIFDRLTPRKDPRFNPITCDPEPNPLFGLDMTSFLARQAIEAGREVRIFDWCKLARYIAKLRPVEIWAGLVTNWDQSCGLVYRAPKVVSGYGIEGRPYKCNAISSYWDIPVFRLENDGEFIPCWTYQSETPGWYPSIIWPELAQLWFFIDGGLIRLDGPPDFRNPMMADLRKDW